MTVVGTPSTFGARRQWLGAGLIGAAVEGVVVWRVGWAPAIPAFLFLGAVGTVASLIDLRTRRIPNALLWPSYPLGAALLALASALGDRWGMLGRAGIAMGLVAGFYLVLALGFPGQLGMADVRLGGLLGLFVGWLGWPELAASVLAGWLLAALAVAWGRARRRSDGGHRSRPIPLGPYLCLGALVAIGVH